MPLVLNGPHDENATLDKVGSSAEGSGVDNSNGGQPGNSSVGGHRGIYFSAVSDTEKIPFYGTLKGRGSQAAATRLYTFEDKLMTLQRCLDAI